MSYFIGSHRLSGATQKQELKIQDWKAQKSRVETHDSAIMHIEVNIEFSSGEMVQTNLQRKMRRRLKADPWGISIY